MKKILFILLVLCTFNFSLLNAGELYEKKVPSKFKKECFKYSSSIKFNNKNNWKFKIKLNKQDVIAIRNNYLVPIIPYKIKGEVLKYKSNIFKKIDFFIDWNLKTSYEFDTEKNKEIILEFDKKIKRNSFGFNFKHSANNYYPVIYVSEDWNKFSEVNFSNLYDFDVKKIKITFRAKYHNVWREKIKIKELIFFKQEKINLIKVKWGWIVDFYNEYNCEDYINLNTLHIPFGIDINTPEITVELKPSPDYNPNIEKDTDLDWIDDNEDNCEEVFNPLQKDSDADGIWDKCSDFDNDGILWHLDNCPKIFNPDQKDINRNSIWDVCEFDKDKDWIFDSVDNCITVKNAFQKDEDWDWIWDKCDNCEFFNPDQEDSNKNNIWDVCDKKIEKLKNNDDDLDWIINWQDNCVKNPNKDQLDTDKDWIWDKCDNCLNLQNKNQLDFNKNGIWDICEDSDSDGITWIEDNCINLSNSDQKDSDNNGVWDACEDKDNDEIWQAIDNCPSIYNPKQEDIDKDWIWDKCDEKDDRLLQSNKSIFIYVLLIIVIIFWFWIYIMIKKLNSKNKVEEIKNKNISKEKKKKKNKKSNWDFEFLNWKSYTKNKNIK